MTRCPEPQLIERLAAGTLTAPERGALLDHAASCAECRAMLDAVAPPPPTEAPDRIGRYELGRVLGRGATGVVYAARDPELDRPIAIKVLRPQMPAERLRREARALAKLTHPNVVRVYDAGEHDGETFIAMELVEGENLREWLRTPRPIAAIIEVLSRAGQGLSAAHRAGFVHRDFKPDNVLLAKTGEVLVGDFGLARAGTEVDATLPNPATALAASPALLTATGALVGTPAYMAPEQTAGEATPASDQFAYCVTAWEACFGARPFAGATLAELFEAVRAGRIERADRDVPPRIERALRRGLAARPDDRFASIDELLRALAPPARRRGVWIAALGIAAATTAIVITTSRTTIEPVRCELAGDAIAPVWDAARRAQLATTWGEPVAGGFERYAREWQRHRIDACRATHERGEPKLEVRYACLDRARATLRTTIDTLLATPRDSWSRIELGIETLPALDRCDRPLDTPPPPFERAGPVAVLDIEMTRADLELLAGWSVSRAAIRALRLRAEELGYAPQILNAWMLDARAALWAGELDDAEATLRRLIVRAEELADDHTRAYAGAILARVLVERRVEEADGLLAIARGAATRAGTDPELEQTLLETEILIATRRGQHARALALQEQVIALVQRRFGDLSGVLVHAYSRLSTLASAAGNAERSIAATQRALELYRSVFPDAPDLEMPLNRVLRGDFDGGAALARRQLASMRAMPVHSLTAEAYVSGQLAFALEMGGDYRAAAAIYRETELLWSRPAKDFTTTGEDPDPVAIANNVVDAVFKHGTCLLDLREPAAAVRELERARALAIAGGANTKAQLGSIVRWLGVARAAAGDYRIARDLLESAEDSPNPFPRARHRFALARALWVDGGPRDRPRALALADDAERDLHAAIREAEQAPALRRLPALARALLAELAAWRATIAKR
jgi:predicted Ser/Thr protein kinase/tetratricopeptide (TPR) repeat protein